MTARFLQYVVSVVLVCAVCVASPDIARAEVDVPPVPDGQHYIWDKADVLSADTESKIGDIQETAALAQDTQIVVVTIHGKAAYGGGGLSIQEFAKQWFNEWGIGIRRGGQLYDRGILLLVSVGDQRARIELGREWGDDWNQYCQRVMDEAMIPAFKEGDFGKGIIRGVDALGQMSTRGPSGSPPKRGTADRMLDKAKDWTRTTSYFSFDTMLAMAGLGLLLVILSIFIKDEKRSRWCFWIGIGIIVLAVLTWVVLGIAAVFLDSGDDTTTGGFSGGGGFGGGMSGGGGASGGW